LDACRSDYTATSEAHIEYRISEPGVHPLFYGTADHFVIDGTTLVLTDYKNGAGVVVEVEGNPQIRYYAYGALLNPNAASVTTVKLRIVQPNAFHPNGPVREEIVSAQEIRDWGSTVLIPAMLRAEMDDSLDPGEWCRFCPAKLICPALTALYAAVTRADPGTLINLSDEALGREYQYRAAVQMYLKAMEAEVFRRLNHGALVPHTKLVNKKADRVWKDGAQERFVAEFGNAAFSKPELLTPAQMENIDVRAKPLVKEWAYSPHTGLTVALDTDKRMGVKVQSISDSFAHLEMNDET
jgi:hypothetical protein